MIDTKAQVLKSGQTSAEERLSELMATSSHQNVRGVSLWQFTPNDLLEFWANHTEEIEPELFDWFESFEEGAAYFDMGASSGVFAIYAALKAKANVFAFEPDAQNYCTADVNIFLNKQHNQDFNIRLFNLAVSNVTKTENMYVRRYQAGTHNKILGIAELRDTAETFTPEHTQSIICFSLDDLISIVKLPIPKYLKIDVDGSEMDVLDGGKNTLSSGKVQEIFIEVYAPEKTAEGKETLQKLNSYGFSEKERYPVQHMRGGVYPDLYNIILKHQGS